ncbi:MAG: type I-E CRISPR-associated protein Cse1/CasA [Treponema sp.]|jgi:CRISPR system Cascade subunit CasA|nr:type I-E CRISPR-associated protein Cse1/CasA [Treponema sp.]
MDNEPKGENPKNRFNLVDEPWIPVAGVGLVSLRRIFQEPSPKSLRGNPVQKIALTKLLLAICQAAYTPTDDEDWDTFGAQGLAEKVLIYLEKHQDCFWLYGEKPFLQMPLIKKLIKDRKKRDLAKGVKEAVAEANAKPKEIGLGYYPDIPSTNNTILTQTQISHSISDAEKTLFIVMLMNFAFGGKRVEKDIEPFSPGYSGKTVSAKSGPSLGNHWGYLHSFIHGDDIITTLWLNTFSREFIKDMPYENKTLVPPPWEQMPEGEDDERARQIKESYMGRLVGMCRFVLLEDDGIFYVEGIQYPSHKEGWREPSMCVDDNTGKLLWANTHQKPWRNLTALLSFLSTRDNNQYNCLQLSAVLKRIRNKTMRIGIWSGGIKVRANSGDQSVKQDDDFVESETFVVSSHLKPWFTSFEEEMNRLKKLSGFLYLMVTRYYKKLNIDGASYADKALELYWQRCERQYQQMVDLCRNPNDTAMKAIRSYFFQCVRDAYEAYCPRDTARQMHYWVQYHPSLNYASRKKRQTQRA